MIQSGQFLNLSEISSMSTLYASFKKFPSQLNDQVMLVKQRFFQQSRMGSSKINDPIWPVFELTRDFIHVHLICNSQEVLIKTE